MLGSEGDSKLDKGVFAHKVLKILGRNDNISKEGLLGFTEESECCCLDRS